MDTKNLGLHLDLYQINMAYSYFLENKQDTVATFEVYFRENPFNGGHCVYVGNRRLLEVLENFSFSKKDIEYLKTIGNYNDEFLDYLQNFKFSGNIYAPKEGEIIFANEPIVLVQAPIIEAQLLETIILNVLNYQILVATKASKIRNATNKALYEFGARRGYETQASLWCAYASIVAGFEATSLVSAGKKFNIPVVGTHAHSFIQMHDSEYDAFYNYAKTFNNVTFLVDTYNVDKSGIPNAIKVANELKGKFNFNAIRIDSGDLAKLSKKSRKLLDDAGFSDVKIMVSNDLDEEVISDLQEQQSPIDAYGIGTKLVSCGDETSLGAVYKLVNIKDKSGSKDVIKLSNTRAKTTTPGIKIPYRLSKDNQAVCDIIAPFDYQFDNKTTIYNDDFVLGKKDYEFDESKPLLTPLVVNGVSNDIFDAHEAKEYNQEQLNNFNDVYLRCSRPEIYPIGLSKEIKELKIKLIKEKEE